MNRKFLEGLGLSEDQTEKIMAAHGKAVQADNDSRRGGQEEGEAKARKAAEAELENVRAQLEAVTAQKAELEQAIADAPDAGDAVKAATAEMEKAHREALESLKAESGKQILDLRRDSETADFLRGLDRKFANPETERAFRQKMNEALQDKANEGKNRADIFKGLSKGEDGGEREDIFLAPAAPLFGAGGHGRQPQEPPGFGFGFTGVRPRP